METFELRYFQAAADLESINQAAKKWLCLPRQLSVAYLGYLPEPLAKGQDLLPLKISDCSYSCESEVYLLASKTNDFGWMHHLDF